MHGQPHIRSNLSLCYRAVPQNCREQRNNSRYSTSELRSATILELMIQRWNWVRDYTNTLFVTLNSPSASMFICNGVNAVCSVYCLAAPQHRDHGFRFLSEHHVCTPPFCVCVIRCKQMLIGGRSLVERVLPTV